MTALVRVLVVDDDEVYCRLMQKGLGRRGYAVEVAHCQLQALNAVRESKLDVVLLDMRLGEESGLGVIEPLLALHPQAKIIMVTGYASLATAVKAVKKGAVNYIAKPVDVASVHKLIEDCLEPTSELDSSSGLEDVSSLPDEAPSLKRLEWEHIQRTLQENEGNVSRTARALGMHRRTLQRKLKKHAP